MLQNSNFNNERKKNCCWRWRDLFAGLGHLLAVWLVMWKLVKLNRMPQPAANFPLCNLAFVWRSYKLNTLYTEIKLENARWGCTLPDLIKYCLTTTIRKRRIKLESRLHVFMEMLKVDVEIVPIRMDFKAPMNQYYAHKNQLHKNSSLFNFPFHQEIALETSYFFTANICALFKLVTSSVAECYHRPR